MSRRRTKELRQVTEAGRVTTNRQDEQSQNVPQKPISKTRYSDSFATLVA